LDELAPNGGRGSSKNSGVWISRQRARKPLKLCLRTGARHWSAVDDTSIRVFHFSSLTIATSYANLLSLFPHRIRASSRLRRLYVPWAISNSGDVWEELPTCLHLVQAVGRPITFFGVA